MERRAFKQAQFAVHDEHAALDIVQDAMLKLSEKYSDRPIDELPPVFQRILQNTIRDHFRRHKVRSMWTTLLSALSPSHEGEEQDPLDSLVVEQPGQFAGDPRQQLEKTQLVALIEKALGTLPARQREAFLLRYWEEMDVAQTAAAMGCSEGSVKTHCSRATHTLAAMLKDQGIEL